MLWAFTVMDKQLRARQQAKFLPGVKERGSVKTRKAGR
jgi:hypothetical protein